jgi:hypothetical protein
MLPGSATVPPPVVLLVEVVVVEVVLVLLVLVMPVPPRTVNDSEGIVPISLSEAEDGPEFSSQ